MIIDKMSFLAPKLSTLRIRTYLSGGKSVILTDEKDKNSMIPCIKCSFADKYIVFGRFENHE